MDRNEGASKFEASRGSESSELKYRSFVSKLFVILEDECFSSIIAWQPDGLAFTIRDPVSLEQQILAPRFNNIKYASFLRQLGYYGFKKTSKSYMDRTYTHVYFQRGRKELLTKIQRKHKLLANEENETSIGRTSSSEEQQQQLPSREELISELEKITFTARKQQQEIAYLQYVIKGLMSEKQSHYSSQQTPTRACYDPQVRPESQNPFAFQGQLKQQNFIPAEHYYTRLPFSHTNSERSQETRTSKEDYYRGSFAQQSHLSTDEDLITKENYQQVPATYPYEVDAYTNGVYYQGAGQNNQQAPKDVGEMMKHRSQMMAYPNGYQAQAFNQSLVYEPAECLEQAP